MAKIAGTLARGAVALLLLWGAAGPAAAGGAPSDCRAPLEPWTRIDLYLGRNIGGGAIVSERSFQRFLAEVVTPRFPEGLSVLDVAGQFRDRRGRLIREPSKLLILLVPDAAAVTKQVAVIVKSYKERFRQESVLRTEHPVCLAFE
jgi:hypothetical protein